MFSILCNYTSSTPRLSHLPLFHRPHIPFSHSPSSLKRSRTHQRNAINSSNQSSSQPKSDFSPQKQQQDEVRSLFPGGFKRPEIRIPNVVLKVTAGEVLGGDDTVSDAVSSAVSKGVGIVLLESGSEGDDESGGRLYEAACVLKGVVRDRAYLLISERVDIAAAVGASGVLLSDQGKHLPPPPHPPLLA